MCRINRCKCRGSALRRWIACPWAAGHMRGVLSSITDMLVHAASLKLQDQKEEQRAKRRRLLSAAASARIRRGMIRYLQVS